MWELTGLEKTFCASLCNSWSIFFFFSPVALLWSVCILAVYQSGAVSPSAGFPERRGVPPQTDRSWTSSTNTGRKQCSLDFTSTHWRGEIPFFCEIVMLGVNKHTHNFPNNLYILCVTIQGKRRWSATLVSMWGRVSSRGCYYRGRGQLSQYNRLWEKRSHWKTENTKASIAIFSLIWHSYQKSMKNSPIFA